MSEAASRNRRNRSAGKAWERKIETDGREQGIDTERTRDSGVKDQGDLVMRINGRYHVIEAKDAKVNMTDFCRQADIESKHFAEMRKLSMDQVHGVAFIKRKGVSSALEGFALLPVREYLRLARAAS